jgi:hypothetical protein
MWNGIILVAIYRQYRLAEQLIGISLTNAALDIFLIVIIPSFIEIVT